MIRQLMDIIPDYPGGYRPIRIRHKFDTIIEQPKKVISDTIQCAKDSLNDSISVDSVSSANVVPGASSGGDDMSMLMWSIFVVLAVLAMCLYFVYSYRKRQLAPV